MGASARQLVTALDVKDMFLQERARIKSSVYFRRKVKVAQAKRRWKKKMMINGGLRRSRRQQRLPTYRRTVGQNSRDNGMGRRVKTLKKLIPNGKSMGLGGLFKETADYISALEMRVEVMQVMVNLLAGSEF